MANFYGFTPKGMKDKLIGDTLNASAGMISEHLASQLAKLTAENASMICNENDLHKEHDYWLKVEESFKLKKK